VRKGCRDPVQRSLSRTALEWRELRQGGNEQSCKHHEGRTNQIIYSETDTVYTWGCLAGHWPNTVSRHQHRGGCTWYDKNIYLELCFLLLRSLLCAIGCCAIYWGWTGFCCNVVCVMLIWSVWKLSACISYQDSI
jgi:hypothetical protein